MMRNPLRTWRTRARARALATGVWTRHNGVTVPVVEMADAHLLNALMKAFLEEDPPEITHPLAAEVLRRGIQSQALALASAREYGKQTDVA